MYQAAGHYYMIDSHVMPGEKGADLWTWTLVWGLLDLVSSFVFTLVELCYVIKDTPWVFGGWRQNSSCFILHWED